MFCNKCGNAIDDNAAFCAGCGNPAKSGNNESIRAMGATAAVSKPQKNLIPLIAVFLLAVAVILLAVVLLKGKQEPTVSEAAIIVQSDFNSEQSMSIKTEDIVEQRALTCLKALLNGDAKTFIETLSPRYTEDVLSMYGLTAKDFENITPEQWKMLNEEFRNEMANEVDTNLLSFSIRSVTITGPNQAEVVFLIEHQYYMPENITFYMVEKNGVWYVDGGI